MIHISLMITIFVYLQNKLIPLLVSIPCFCHGSAAVFSYHVYIYIIYLNHSRGSNSCRLNIETNNKHNKMNPYQHIENCICVSREYAHAHWLWPCLYVWSTAPFCKLPCFVCGYVWSMFGVWLCLVRYFIDFIHTTTLHNGPISKRRIRRISVGIQFAMAGWDVRGTIYDCHTGTTTCIEHK